MIDSDNARFHVRLNVPYGGGARGEPLRRRLSASRAGIYPARVYMVAPGCVAPKSSTRV